MTSVTATAPEKNLTQWVRDCAQDLHGAADGMEASITVLNSLRSGKYENDPIMTTLLLDRAISEAERARDEVRSAAKDLHKMASGA